MPYTNIVFVKLEKRILSDPRWYMMSEPAQLNYIKFMAFAAETYNRIPKNITAIKKAFKTDQDTKTIEKSIEEIRANFPKFKENKHFYYFKGFEYKTNFIPKGETPGKPQRMPKVDVYKDKEEEEDKYKEIYGQNTIYRFITNNIYFKRVRYPARLTHRLMDRYGNAEVILRELKKMDEWLLANPNREKKNYERFITGWLKREEGRLVAVGLVKNLAESKRV